MSSRREAGARRKRRRSRRRNDDGPGLSVQLARWYALRARHQRWLALGATLAIIGLGLVGSRETDVGAVIVLVGLITLVFSIHRYGRLGEER